MADVFISYSSRDRGRVLPLVEALQAAGVRVFWDAQIKPGEAWEVALQDGLRAAKAVIVFWSTLSVQSDWVRDEASYAFVSGKLITIKIDAEVKIPPPFVSLNHLDFSRSADQASFEQLFLALEQLGVTTAIPLAGSQQTAPTKNRGFAFISHVEEDVPIVGKIPGFLKTRDYAYWTYHESDRDYQKPTVLEIEERMVECVLMLTVISPDWKRSEWTQRELAFAREVKKPLFHLRFRNPGPTLAIAGDTYFDFERGEEDAFKKLGLELDKKGL